MNYNKSEIMRNAWKIHNSRRNHVKRVLRNGIYVNIPFVFADALRKAWYDAKETMRLANRSPEQVEVDDAIFLLKMKDHWNDADRAQYNILIDRFKRLQVA